MTDDMNKRDVNPANDPDATGSDEIRKADDRAASGGDAPAGAPTARPNWQASEWEGQNQPNRTQLDEAAHAAVNDATSGDLRWNEGEVVGERQGGPDEGPTERIVPSEGENEFSGHGHNPGGGERWADVDRGDDAESKR